MPGSYIFLDHTADRRMKVTGTDLESLFQQGVKGLRQLLITETQQSPGEGLERQVEISAPDTTVLLIDFLSEVLTYTHIDKAIYKEVYFDYLNSDTLKARIHGRRVNGFAEEIKAVTYHEAEVKQSKEGGWESMVIFDI
jgi:SHS2 domain-containing protein